MTTTRFVRCGRCLDMRRIALHENEQAALGAGMFDCDRHQGFDQPVENDFSRNGLRGFDHRPGVHLLGRRGDRGSGRGLDRMLAKMRMELFELPDLSLRAPAKIDWNYFAPSLNDQNGGAYNGLEPTLIPWKVDGVQQELHIDPPVVTNPNAKSGPRTGLGDTQIYNFTLTKVDIGLPDKVTFGAGPLIAVPTDTSTNFGPNTFQGGVAGVVLAPQSWGLLGVLATYQHTLWGAGSERTTVQPIAFYNIKDGYYLRSSAIMTFDTTATRRLSPLDLAAAR